MHAKQKRAITYSNTGHQASDTAETVDTDGNSHADIVVPGSSGAGHDPVTHEGLEGGRESREGRESEARLDGGHCCTPARFEVHTPKKGKKAIRVIWGFPWHN